MFFILFLDGRQLIGQQQSIQQNKLITTLNTLGKEFKVSFGFYATSKGTWGKILHFMVGNSDTNGDRIPTVYYSGTLQINFLISGREKSFSVYSVTVNKWHSVKIEQKQEGNSFRFSITVDGKKEHNVINTDAREFRNVKVYANDPWYRTQPGYIRNLYFDTKGNFYYFSKHKVLHHFLHT